jgi:4-hydroxy-3-polyprenylbenzoate decarboxylase
LSKKIILAIGAASGAVYARAMLKLLARTDTHIEIIISPQAHSILKSELDISNVDAAAIADMPIKNFTLHDPENLSAGISSGSVPVDGMIICPCSSNTLACIAAGQGATLTHRAAYVTLKQRRPLVVVHREAPLTAIDIENMARVTAAGAIVFPASPVFYTRPQSISDLAENLACRVLELAGIRIENPRQWQGTT